MAEQLTSADRLREARRLIQLAWAGCKEEEAATQCAAADKLLAEEQTYRHEITERSQRLAGIAARERAA